MPSLTFTVKYAKNTGRVMSPSELLLVYFYGVDILSTDGSKLDNNTIRSYISSAQEQIEKYFAIKLLPILITEKLDYNRDDYSYGFPQLKTSWPVRIAKSFIGKLNGIEQIVYPESWLSYRTTNTGKYHRQLAVVPNGSVINSDADVILTGVSSHYGIRSYPRVPYYWDVQYETGFNIDEIPEDLLQMVGMLAAIPLLAIAGDLILGAGIASQSLSIDGLSQSISSTSSATNAGYGARIIEYRKVIDGMKKEMKGYYKGIGFTVV